WEVPDVIMSGDEGTGFENAASWIGIDGAPDGGEFVPLRAGVVSMVTENGTTAFAAFAGWDRAAVVHIANLEVKAKDTVIVAICSAEEFQARLANIHFAIQHGAATNFQLSAPSDSFLAGFNAEFVVTKQYGFGAPIGFPNYGSVRFVDAMAITIDDQVLPVQNGETFDLVAGGRTVSQGVGLPNNVVQCTYLP
ncbi:MAG TPA: G1 family glutamic endopeptidase, partial [Aggregatilineaceae bacterium]|nr:G1 family glutamic endopeptidase [Aggregatilineaceae bacterium]